LLEETKLLPLNTAITGTTATNGINQPVYPHLVENWDTFETEMQHLFDSGEEYIQQLLTRKYSWPPGVHNKNYYDHDGNGHDMTQDALLDIIKDIFIKAIFPNSLKFSLRAGNSANQCFSDITLRHVENSSIVDSPSEGSKYIIEVKTKRNLACKNCSFALY
jgi:poly-beta-hydroxyalkanoate depolymerase